MRARIKVMDLSVGQWEYLQTQLRGPFEMPDGAVRMCVEFELSPEQDTRHVEMSPRAFIALMVRLHEVQARVQSILLPDALPDRLPVLPTPDEGRTCDHGATVVAQMPSAFSGADPIRDYADGCVSFGPYRNEGWRDEATGLVSGGLVTDEG